MAKKIKNQKVEKSGIESRFTDLTKKSNPTIITLYGKSGSGKTTLLATCPKPLLLIDIKDKGDESAKYDGLEEGDITVIEIEHFDDMYEIYDYIQDNPKKFKTVGIDHMTALQEFSHDKVKEEEGKQKMSQQMFGFSASYLKEIVGLYKNLTDLGITPVFLCQDRLESGEGEGEDQLMPEVGPGLMPSVSKLLCSASRVIGHTYIQESVTKSSDLKVHRSIEYRLRLGPNPYYITKVTKPKGYPCPPYVVNASYDDIMSVIKGTYQEKGQDKKKVKKKKKK